MASFWYDPAFQDIFQGTIDLDTDDIRMLLLDDTGTYTPAKGTTFIDTGGANDIVDSEVTSGDISGYARVALASKAIDISSNLIRFNSNNVAFGALGTSGSGKNVSAAVIYLHTGTDTTSIPIIYSDFTDTPTNGGTFTVNQPANGWGHGDNT
jgi:hypothetical protein